MKFTVLRKDFAKVVSFASRFVSPRVQLPILSNILVTTDKTKLVIQATNLEMSFSTTIGAQIETEGSIALPARVLSDLASHMSGESLTAEIVKESLTLTAEGFSSQIAALNARDFPPIATTLSEQAVTLPETFIHAINHLLFATSTDEARPVLTGILFLVTENGLTCVSSDGFRLSKYELEISEDAITALGVNDRFIIPKTALSEFVKLAGESGATTLEKRANEGQVFLSANGSIIASRIIEGQFPNFERIIPKNSKVTVSISRSDFLESLKRAAVFARDAGNTVFLKVNADGIILSAESQQVGKQESVLSAKVDGGEASVAFNYKYLEDFLMSGSSESIIMKVTDETSAGVFLNPDESHFLHLIMPVRA